MLLLHFFYNLHILFNAIFPSLFRYNLVALPGKDVKGNDCVKIVRTDSIAMADNNQVCYLTLSHQTITRTYGDGQSKAIAYNYVAQQTTIKPEDAPYLEIAANGGRRLVDTLGITQKLDREGGDATDVKVTFADPSADQEPEPLKSNTKLGTLISQIKGWLSALKALAFKEKVAKDDLDANLTKELNDKVDKVNGKGLSTNDFTDKLKEKLKGIDDNANKYTHPNLQHIPTGGESGHYLKWSTTGTAAWYKLTASDIGAAASGHTHTLASLGAAASDHTHAWNSITGRPSTFSPSTHSHDAATTSTAGFMSTADKKKLDKIDISISGNKLTFTWQSNITATGAVSANLITYTATLSGSSSSSFPGGSLVTQP